MTKYTDHDLRAEIHAVLDDLAARQEPWRPQWVTHQICDGHRRGLNPEGEADAAFWMYAGYAVTRKATTECINDRADPPLGQPVAPQLALPGFDRVHLQDYYVVTRGDGDVAVCVVDMTDAEALAKAALYRSHSRTALAHAAELERFVTWRQELALSGVSARDAAPSPR